jgi:hypothetical protein
VSGKPPPGVDPVGWASFTAEVAKLARRGHLEAPGVLAWEAGELALRGRFAANPTVATIAALARYPLSPGGPTGALIAAAPPPQDDPYLAAVTLLADDLLGQVKFRRPGTLSAAAPVLNPCATCEHLADQHEDPFGCCQPGCGCGQFVAIVKDGIPEGWPADWPRPTYTQLRTIMIGLAALAIEKKRHVASVVRDRRRRLVRNEPAAVQNALQMLASACPPPTLSAAAKARLSRHNRPLPAYRGGRGWGTVDLDKRTITDVFGEPVRGVRVTATGALVAAAPELEPFELPASDSRLDRLMAFSMGALDRLSLVARKELEVEEDEGAFARLAEQVGRLADRPQPTIEVKPPDVHVTVPEQPPVNITVRPTPVTVNVEPPKPRGIRVVEDRMTGERTFLPIEADELEDD